MVYYPKLAFLYVWWIKAWQVSYYASVSPFIAFLFASYYLSLHCFSLYGLFPISWNNVPDKLECCSN